MLWTVWKVCFGKLFQFQHMNLGNTSLSTSRNLLLLEWCSFFRCGKHGTVHKRFD
jgi:hypothetical protein